MMKGRSPKAVSAAGIWQVVDTWCSAILIRLATSSASYCEAAVLLTSPCPRVSSVIFTLAVAARHS